MENDFGEFLREKRIDKKLTQKQLADKLFVSMSAVSKWEKNVAHPDITLLPKLSEILGVTEHELITASIDKKSREEKCQAKKWRTLSFTWSLFFYIAYAVALIPCFICNIAINGTLSWFWIVLSSLLLAFTFTSLPKLIKTHKLLILPLSIFGALCILLATCAIYTRGNWFWIAVLSVLLGFIIIFVPIYMSKYKIFQKFKNYNDFVSLFVDFVFLNILLIVIYFYTVTSGFAITNWYFKIALPIALGVYVILNLLMSVRFFKFNKALKTSIILFFINILYIIVSFIRVDDVLVQHELAKLDIFEADLSNWQVEISLERNIHLIIFLVVLTLAVTFLASGIILHLRNRKNND